MKKSLISAIAAILICNSSIAQTLSYELITSVLDAVSFEIGLTKFCTTPESFVMPVRDC